MRVALQELVSEADQDNDGNINYEEFTAMLVARVGVKLQSTHLTFLRRSARPL